MLTSCIVNQELHVKEVCIKTITTFEVSALKKLPAGVLAR